MESRIARNLLAAYALALAAIPAWPQVVTNPAATGISTASVTAVACTPAQGVTCTVATPSTTPTLSVGLGAITPTSLTTATIGGTPTITLTNATGTASGLTAGTVTTNANLTGPITSTGNATAVAAQTGTGTTFVMQATPTLTTPVLGAATATTINGNTITTGTGTLTLGAGKTLTASNSLTLAGTDGKTFTFPTQNAKAVGFVGTDTYANTVANFPCNGTWSGFEAYISDWGANGAKARCNGTRWLPIAGRVLLKHMAAASSTVNATPTIVAQTPAMPAGIVQAGDSIVFEMPGFTKSGTTDTGSWFLYAGTAGTTSDTAVVNTNNQVLAAANQSGAVMVALKVVSNTSVQRVGSASGGWTAVSAVAAASPVTITDLSANADIFSFGISSSGATNTVLMQDGAIWHVVN